MLTPVASINPAAFIWQGDTLVYSWVYIWQGGHPIVCPWVYTYITDESEMSSSILQLNSLFGGVFCLARYSTLKTMRYFILNVATTVPQWRLEMQNLLFAMWASLLRNCIWKSISRRCYFLVAFKTDPRVIGYYKTIFLTHLSLYPRPQASGLTVFSNCANSHFFFCAIRQRTIFGGFPLSRLFGSFYEIC